MGTTSSLPSALILQKPNCVLWELGTKRHLKSRLSQKAPGGSVIGAGSCRMSRLWGGGDSGGIREQHEERFGQGEWELWAGGHMSRTEALDASSGTDWGLVGGENLYEG